MRATIAYFEQENEQAKIFIEKVCCCCCYSVLNGWWIAWAMIVSGFVLKTWNIHMNWKSGVYKNKNCVFVVPAAWSYTVTCMWCVRCICVSHAIFQWWIYLSVLCSIQHCNNFRFFIFLCLLAGCSLCINVCMYWCLLSRCAYCILVCGVYRSIECACECVKNCTIQFFCVFNFVFFFGWKGTSNISSLFSWSQTFAANNKLSNNFRVC